MQKRNRELFLVLLCSTTCVLGCSEPQSTTEPQPKGESAAPIASLDAPTKASEPTSETQIPALQPSEPRPGKKTWDRETAGGAEIPTDIPVYTDSIAIDGSLDKRMFVFEWHSSDPKSDVMDFFREQLPAKGWDVVSEKSYGAFKATKDDREMDVWIGWEKGKPVSIMIRRML